MGLNYTKCSCTVFVANLIIVHSDQTYYGSIHQIDKRADRYHPDQVYDPFNPWATQRWTQPSQTDQLTRTTKQRLPSGQTTARPAEITTRYRRTYFPVNKEERTKTDRTTSPPSLVPTTHRASYLVPNTDRPSSLVPITDRGSSLVPTTERDSSVVPITDRGSSFYRTKFIPTAASMGPFYVNKDLRLLSETPTKQYKVAEGRKVNLSTNRE